MTQATLKRLVCLLACGLALVSLAEAASTAVAATEPDMGPELEYIQLILGMLNNEAKCELPSYSQVDALDTRFAKLREAWGSDFEARLSPDQKLVLDTVLARWSAFQQYMEFAIGAAKKRSFLGLVEKYQLAKFGNSICTKRAN